MNSLDPRAERDRGSVRTCLCLCCYICVSVTPANRLSPNFDWFATPAGTADIQHPSALGLLPSLRAHFAQTIDKLTCQRSPASLLDTYSIFCKRHRSSETTTLCLLRARSVLKPSLVPLYSAPLVRVSFILPAAALIYCFVVPVLVVSPISLVLPPHPRFAILSLTPAPTADSMSNSSSSQHTNRLPAPPSATGPEQTDRELLLSMNANLNAFIVKQQLVNDKLSSKLESIQHHTQLLKDHSERIAHLEAANAQLSQVNSAILQISEMRAGVRDTPPVSRDTCELTFSGIPAIIIDTPQMISKKVFGTLGVPELIGDILEIRSLERKTRNKSNERQASGPSTLPTSPHTSLGRSYIVRLKSHAVKEFIL